MGTQQIDGKQLDLIGEDWHVVGDPGEPAFEDSWVNYNTVSYTEAAFYKDPAGIVHLKGLVKTGAVPSTVFTLPKGYRPAYVLHITCVSSQTTPAPRFKIYEDGRVYASVGSSTWMCLDHITFVAEQ